MKYRIVKCVQRWYGHDQKRDDDQVLHKNGFEREEYITKKRGTFNFVWEEKVMYMGEKEGMIKHN